MKKILNSNQIKLIAIAAMTVDHIAWALFPGYSLKPLPMIMHLIGRLTCPIMCFFIAEGFYYTRSVRKYTLRLFVFAGISHFAYVFASESFVGWKSFIPFSDGNVFHQTGVLWSLAWGLVLLRLAKSETIRGAGRFFLMALVCVISVPADWSCVAALCVVAIGINRGNFKKQMGWMMLFIAAYAAVCCLSIDVVYGLLQLGTALSIPLLWLYNGERGRNPLVNKVMKWVFYLYYPLHLLVIGLAEQLWK